MESQIALCFLFARGIFKMHGMVVGCSIWVWFCVFGCFCFDFLLTFLFAFLFLFFFVCFVVVDMTKLSLCILIGDPQWITSGKWFKINFLSLSPSLGVT